MSLRIIEAVATPSGIHLLAVDEKSFVLSGVYENLTSSVRVYQPILVASTFYEHTGRLVDGAQMVKATREAMEEAK